MDIVYITGVLSLCIQVITGILNMYVLQIQVPKELLILQKVLVIELGVQMVEFLFYVWMVYNFNKIKNITPTRYWDWAITTPTMLLSFSVYLMFLKETQEKKVIEGTIIQLLIDNATVLVPVVILNWFMLVFGYLGEMKQLSLVTANIFGFIPFVMFFYILFENFAKYTVQGTVMFSMFSGVWALYGVAFLLPYKIKNAMYNILDLFSKNFFGLFLSGLLYYESRTTVFTNLE